ncbi:MAG: TonB-dependent receptor plug domain-containing protein [Gemmatimonadota bacterium]|jgi:hypothetical protein
MIHQSTAARPTGSLGRRGWAGWALLALLVLSACATRPTGYDPDDSMIPGGIMITRQQIERSRANDALEALERARTHLSIQWKRQGDPPSITHRGVDSLVRDGDVLVVVDGAPTLEAARVLRNIAAEHIAFMKVLSSREGTPRYGLLAGNGVVYVRTLAYELPGARNRLGAR